MEFSIFQQFFFYEAIYILFRQLFLLSRQYFFSFISMLISALCLYSNELLPFTCALSAPWGWGGGGGGGCSLYKPYRYVPPQRVGFLRLFVCTGIHFANFGLESGMVFEGATGAFKRIYRFNSK